MFAIRCSAICQLRDSEKIHLSLNDRHQFLLYAVLSYLSILGDVIITKQSVTTTNGLLQPIAEMVNKTTPRKKPMFEQKNFKCKKVIYTKS